MARANRGDARHERATDLAGVGEHVRDAITEKLAEQARRRPRDTAKGRAQAEALELLGERISALDLWTRTPPGEHGARATRVTRDELAAAAVRIADADGFGSLSMRRLATELGVGTMTLYHYVRNKDELLSLLVDTVMGELVVPDDELPDGWREALTVLATRSRHALRRHPWILDIADDPPIGPNAVRHFDQTLQAISSIDVPLTDALHIAAVVDELVFGYCLHERNDDQTRAEPEHELLDHLSSLLEAAPLPALSRLVDEHGLEGLWELIRSSSVAPDRFDRHLATVLDGIEATITAATAPPHPN